MIVIIIPINKSVPFTNNNKDNNLNMLLLLATAILLQLSSPHLIISLTPSNSQVNAVQNLTVVILTSAVISANSLTLNLPTQFATSSICSVNGTSDSCVNSVSASYASVTYASTLAASTYYTLMVQVTNPSYATNFPVIASVGGLTFSNTGLVAITPKTIICSMTSASSIVGDSATGSITLQNSLPPANSKIVINSSHQTTFSNLFASSPTCSYFNTSLTCSLSSSFGQQFLTISSIPTSSNLTFSVSNINNAPFNSSFITATLLLQNSNSYTMETCTLTQPKPTILRNSIGVSATNWNGEVGAVSNVTLTVNTFFTPYTNKVVLEHNSNFIVSVLSPTTLQTTWNTNGATLLLLDGGVASGNSLSYLLSVTNPQSQQPMYFTTYVIYSATQYIEFFNLTTLTLSPLTLPFSLTLSSPLTLTPSTYNLSTSLSFDLTTPTIIVSLAYGQLQCNSLNLQSSVTLTVVSCNVSQLQLNASIVSVGNLWLSVQVVNWISVRADNNIKINIKGAAPSYYSVGSGTAGVSLTGNSQTFTITNQNTTFAAATTFIIQETTSFLSIISTAIRKVTLTLPSDLFFTSPILSPINISTTLLNYSATPSTNSILLYITGPLSLIIAGISNPVLYLNSTTWYIRGTDTIGNPSFQSSTLHTPFYTPTQAKLDITMSNNVIEGNGTMQLTVVPVMQYQYGSKNPTVSVYLANSTVLSVCSSCTLVSSTTFVFPLTSSTTRTAITLTNSLRPSNNTISITITLNNITFQTGTASYTLSPMTLTYTVSQLGFYGQLGSLNITVGNLPSAPLTLSYSSLANILSSSTCNQCNGTQIYATGLVQHFSTQYIIVSGISNGLTYAQVNVTVDYICSSIQGCQVCSNNSTTSTLQCQQCFTSAFTNLSLLYQHQCLSSCPLTTYSNGLKCMDCPALCQQCNLTACLLCNNSYLLYNGSCLTSCPAPLVANATHCMQVPVVCPTNCANCPLDNICLACDSPYLLLSNSCLSSCPPNYKPNNLMLTCEVFIPPAETSYFPFPFLIASTLLTIALVFVKCWDRRSLVMGNLIAFLSIVEVGSMIMTLVYTFQSGTVDLLVQALIFILILSKIILNILFLIYFLKVIATDEDFLSWRQNDDSHEYLYRTLLIFSSILSFQTIRIIYSRLMGLRLFFGKFNTALIFKPLNYFTVAHFLICSSALIALSIRNIVAQDCYRTSTFYSSVESIILEILLLGACILDNKKGYDDQFFEYQVYKVKNQYESSHIQPIEIEQQAENGGSMHEMLNATRSESFVGHKQDKSSQIIKNPSWVRKVHQPPSLQDAQIQSALDEENQLQKEQGGLVANVQEHKKERLYRRKFIEEWRRIQKELPKHIHYIRTRKDREGKNRSISRQNRKKVDQAMKRTASLELFEVRLPQTTGSIPERIKQYFYQFNTLPKQQPKKRKQRRLNQLAVNQNSGSKEIILDQEEDWPRVATLSVQRGQHYMEYDTSDPNIFQAKEEDLQYGSNRDGSVATHVPPISRAVEDKQELQQEKQDNFTDEMRSNHSHKQDELDIEFSLHQNPLRRQIPAKQLKTQGKQIMVDYRYQEGGDERQKQKRYRTRKRRVNKQTEGVYLQRLVASSDKRMRPKARKIDF